MKRNNSTPQEETEARFESALCRFFEHSPDLMCIVDSQGLLKHVNHALLKTFGYTEKELLSRPFADFVHPEDLERVTSEIAKHHRDEQAASWLEVRCLYGDGSHKWVAWSATVLPENRLLYVVGHDISDRKRAEELTRIQRDLALRLAETDDLIETVDAILQSILEAVGFDAGGIYILDEKSDAYVLVSHKGLSDDFVRTVSRFESDSANYKLVQQGQGVYMDYDRIPLPKEDAEKREGLKSIAIVPVTYSGRQIGCVNVTSHTVGEITEGSKYIIETLAGQVGQAIVRSQLASSLRASGETLKIIFDSMPGLVFFKDKENRLVRANRTLCEAMGLPEEEIIGRPLSELFPDQSEEYWRDDLEVIESGIPKLGIVEPMETPEGTRWLRTDKVPYRNADGEIVGVIGMSVDITERKRVEEALQAAEKKYRELAESLPQVVFELDADGKIIYVNQNALEEFGYSREELESGIHALDVIAEVDRERVDGAIYKMYSGQSTGSVREYIAKRKDGTEFPCIVYSTLITDAVGNPAGIRGILTDISERKCLETELQRVNTELKGFAHIVSHDLRGPLSAMDLAGKTIRKLLDTPPTEETRKDVGEMLETISSSAQQSNRLIQDLLSLAVAGQERREVSGVDIGDAVAQVLEERKRDIDEKGIEVKVVGDLGQVRAERTYIYQVFSNLIGNAIRHGTSNSPEIQVRHLGDVNSDEGNIHRYLVRDNGQGIPEGDLENIFTPFFKAGYTGETGIGLAIVQKIVALYGGEIKAYNDNGACFEFTLRDFDEGEP